MRRDTVAIDDVASLRPLHADDAIAVERWYGKAIVLAGSPVPLGELFDSSEPRRIFVLTDVTNPDPVGLFVVAIDNPEPGWATVDLLVIARQEERDVAAWAVAMLEAYVQGETRRIRAAVPLDTGLALYFWLRLGYRPVVSGRTLWMTRELEA